MTRGAIVGALTGVCLTSIVGLTAVAVNARASYESPYGYDRTWNAAVRLVRVDNGWKVTEKDDASGYLLFEYKSPESPKASPGSLELVRGADADSPVHVLAQLTQMPRYHEQALLDALAAKMRREYGDPPVKRKRPPPAEPDAGSDASGAGAEPFAVFPAATPTATATR